MKAASPSILLTTEGTYPHYGGGVSVWCDQLVRYLSDNPFHIFSVTHAPRLQAIFTFPENVRSMKQFALWGTEEPGDQPQSYSEVYQRKLRVDSDSMEDDFLPCFRILARAAFHGEVCSPKLLAGAIMSLRRYFNEYDFKKSMSSPEAWQIFLEESARPGPGFEPFTLQEATKCLRWLLRYASIVTANFEKTDVVHASIAGLAGVPGVISKLEHGSKFLITEHGIYLRELYVALGKMQESSNCLRFLLNWNRAIVRMNYHFADSVTSLGEFNRKWQLRFGAPEEKIRIFPNGVESKRFYPDPSQLPERLTVITLARIYALKGIDTLLKAAAIIVQRAPNTCFKIYGEIADPAYYENCLRIVREHRLENNVEFTVTKRPEDAFRAAHIFCLPSISEGLPYSVLEAMFSGCPVVASDVGVVADTLAGTGLLVRPNDPEGLASQLLYLLDGPEAAGRRAKLGAKGLARARECYQATVTTKKFEDLYDELSVCQPDFQTA